MKRVLVSEYIEAIKKDEVPWQKGGWFDNYLEEGVSYIRAACVLGVGCINMGIENNFYKDRLMNGLYYSKIARKRELTGVFERIISYNDSAIEGAKTWEEARDYAIAALTPYADLAFWAEEAEYTMLKES